MPDPNRMPEFLYEPKSSVGRFYGSSRTDFFREEFIKHCRCLERQREYFSEGAVTCVEAALQRLMARLEQLSSKEDADQLVSRLLRKLDVVTGLSYWTDQTKLH